MSAIKLMLTCFFRHKLYFIVVALFIILGRSLTMLWPFCLNKILDLTSANQVGPLFWIITFGGCFLAGEVMLRIAAYLFLLPMSDTRRYIQSYFYHFVMHRSFAFVGMRPSGEIFNKLNQIYTSVDTLLDRFFWVFLSIAVNLSAALVMFVTLSGYLACIFLVWSILYGICIKKILIFSHKKWKAVSKSSSDLAGYIVNALDNFLVLKIYPDQKGERLNSILDEHINTHKAAHRFTVHAYSLQEIMTFVLGFAALVFCYIAYQMSKIKMQEIVMVITILMILKERLHSLSIRIQDAMKSWGLLSGALYDLYQDRYLEIAPCPSKTVDHQSIAIELKNLSFSFTSHILLQHINLKIAPKEKVALIGPSGSGKSTLSHLILGCYQPSSGQVLINHLQNVEPTSWYRCIAYVPQYPILVNGTIYDNIRLGKLSATYQEIVTAAKQARCHDFITSFSNGYMTYIRNAGIELSGGQRQKICMARAMLKDAPFVLFDEPTSGIDYQEESQLVPLIFEYLKDKTVLYITHRPTALVSFDRIIKIAEGKLVVQK